MKILAIICTVIAGIGVLILITESATVGEAMPPTIMFAIAAVFCWGAVGKKRAVITDSNEEEESQYWSEDLRKGLKKDQVVPNGKEYDWKLKEIWEDYPVPDYKAIHTYCTVAFDDSGKTYYYRTRNPELRVGDTVYVPFGDKEPKKIGVITGMADYVGYDAPFPLEKTKYVIGKV